jgi:dihydrofolate reductase
MRQLIMKMSMTIDGFVGGPNGENDWVFRSSDETSKASAVERFWEVGLIIMGRKSFEAMAPYWPTAPGPFATPMNEIPKAVFTKSGFEGVTFPDAEQSPATASWTQARVFDGDLAEGITQLKAEPGKPVYAIGGAGFVRSLMATGLIDEYQLVTHPVVLGAGLPVFNGVTHPLDLTLVDVKSFAGGIVSRTYRKPD